MNGFIQAKPIWAKGLSSEKNITYALTTTFDFEEGAEIVLRVTGSCLFRAFVNGKLCAYGPARATHGYFRIDEWRLSAHCRPGKNALYIETAGYNVNSFYTLDQPSFVQAELICDGQILAATGQQGFAGRVVTERVQKVPRYSFQRPFTEAWRIGAAYANAPKTSAEYEICPPVKYLPRNVNYPEFATLYPRFLTQRGTASDGHRREHYQRDRSLLYISEKLKGFPMQELEVPLSDLAQEFEYAVTDRQPHPLDEENELHLKAGEYAVVQFSRCSAGFPALQVSCSERLTLWILWDECMTDGDVSYTRHAECVNAMRCEFEAGQYDFVGFECYAIQGIKLIAMGADCTIKNVSIKEFVAPVSYKECPVDDQDIRDIYDAAVYAFQGSCIESFMDSASRERNSSLWDSLFMARPEKLLTNECKVEKNFFENYALATREDFLPLEKGMLPPFYPAEHYDGFYVPTHTMMFIVQLGEYVQRSGDHTMASFLREKVYDIYEYLDGYTNEYGLLEGLPGWNFVDWSKAAELTTGQSYLVNMLFSKALDTMFRLYGDTAAKNRAERVRQTVREMSFDGTYFTDHAVRIDGKLVNTGEHSETAQYHAFFFGVATPGEYAELWNKLVNQCGPKHGMEEREPTLYPCGTYTYPMRLELLLKYGETQEFLRSVKGYYLHMVRDTGTLWERAERNAGVCNCSEGLHSNLVYLFEQLRLMQ